MLYPLCWMLLSTAGLIHGSQSASAPPETMDKTNGKPYPWQAELLENKQKMAEMQSEIDSKTAQLHDLQTKFNGLSKSHSNLQTENQIFKEEIKRMIQNMSQQKDHLTQLLLHSEEQSGQFKHDVLSNSNEKPNQIQVRPANEISKRTFDETKMDNAKFKVIGSSNTLIHLGSIDWNSVGITEPFISGTHSIKFKMSRSRFRSIKYAVLRVPDFNIQGCLDYAKGKIIYETYHGTMNFGEKAYIELDKADIDDVIGITVNINSDPWQSTITFTKNGHKMKVGYLSEYMPEYSLDKDVPLMFVVAMEDTGDRIEIID